MNNRYPLKLHTAKQLWTIHSYVRFEKHDVNVDSVSQGMFSTIVAGFTKRVHVIDGMFT